MLFRDLKLKEHTVYKVKVSLRSGNPHHWSLLWVGFDNGAYNYLMNNTYEENIPVGKHSKADFAEVIELTEMKR